jgi:hypothetical protein
MNVGVNAVEFSEYVRMRNMNYGKGLMKLNLMIGIEV